MRKDHQGCVMLIIFIVVALLVVWLWFARLYVRIVGKFLWWFIKELIATPAAVSKDIRRLRAHAAARHGIGATADKQSDTESEWIAATGAKIDAVLAREPTSVTVMNGVPPERNEWRNESE